MKKLMIVAAAVMVAAVTQAATMSWSMTSLRNSSGTTLKNGCLVCLYATGTTFSYDAAKAGTLAAAYSSTTSQAVISSQGNNKPDGNSYAVGDKADYYAVIFNAGTISAATEYIVSDSRSATVDPTGANIKLMYGKMTGTQAASNAFYGKSWESVPEPTSGLLLLLGVAGLALKRKRA